MPRIFIADVMCATATVLGVSLKAIKGDEPGRALAWPRMIAMAMAVELTHRDTQYIATRFRRDKTSIYKAQKVVARAILSGALSPDTLEAIRAEAAKICVARIGMWKQVAKELEGRV